MSAACFIPIKSNSERVPGKNFRILNGKKLYEYILAHAREANVFDDIYVDTDSEELKDYCLAHGYKVIEREAELSKNTANGNDLLVHHYKMFPGYDYYYQLFATAPYLQPESIKGCHLALSSNSHYDSCFTATENHGFYWLKDNPINYRPCILPRSQDMAPVIEETTGMYGMRSDALEKYRCRIGSHPYIYVVNKFEAVDINTEADLQIAEYIGKVHWHYSFNETHGGEDIK